MINTDLQEGGASSFEEEGREGACGEGTGDAASTEGAALVSVEEGWPH